MKTICLNEAAITFQRRVTNMGEEWIDRVADMNMLKCYVPPPSINSSVGTTGLSNSYLIILQVFLTLLKSRHSHSAHSSQAEHGDRCHAAEPLSTRPDVRLLQWQQVNWWRAWLKARSIRGVG